MKAAILEAFNQPFVVDEVTLTDPGPTDVIVRMSASAFCVTDCINQRGELGKKTPTILGHSAVGVVEEIGLLVQRVRVGDRVVIPATPECDRCYYCARGRPDQCAELFRPQPVVGQRGDGSPITTTGQGTYAELLRLPEIITFRAETDLPDEQMAMVGCGVTSGLGAIFNVAAVEAGSSVAVFGCGHIGLWMIQGARVAGASQIIAVEPLPERRALAARLGATDLVDPADENPVDQVRSLTGGHGADYALEAAGATVAMTQTFLAARNAGTVVITGAETRDADVTVPALELALRGRTVHSCQNGNVRMRRDLARFIDLMERGLVDATPLMGQHYDLHHLNEAARAADAREHPTGIIVPTGA